MLMEIVNRWVVVRHLKYVQVVATIWPSCLVQFGRGITLLHVGRIQARWWQSIPAISSINYQVASRHYSWVGSFPL